MKNKIALIAGAANEVGQAISIKFARSGAKLILVDSDSQGLDAVALDKDVAGALLDKVSLDPTDSNSVKAAVANLLERHGAVDILINNFDHKDGLPISEGTLTNWESSLKENLTPVISFCLNVIPAMQKRKYGRIVTVGSLEYLGVQNRSNYSTSKSALFGMTRSFALETAKDGITVNQVIKGDIKLQHADELSAEAEAKAAGVMPVQRLGKPEDIAFAVAYLAVDSSRYVTGQNLIVCGGKSIYSSMSA
ncbi:MAG: SDR family NAD(P)-dependent oxidoreductase [Desulfuromonadaceae bacterium]|nr:SDR family NAD(P)-dependent oxidoreductase [Desulfuromonadaceae bacterium]